MELINGTKFDLQATQGLDKAGAPWLIVMAKATYRFGSDESGRPALADQQNKLIASDLFEAEPGLSTPFFESDYVPKKLACDVIVKGNAHAPHVNGQPRAVSHLDVGLIVQRKNQKLLKKVIRVYGERQWYKRMAGLWALTEAEPFTVMPVTYGRAFGGMHTHTAIDSSDPNDFCAHGGNLVGRGYASGKFVRLLEGAPAHQTELWINGHIKPIVDPEKRHAPASLGPIARNWAPRLQWAGTYDAAWQENVFPLLPADFDERYYQCAPLDQQMAFPSGGETITLANLTATAAAAYASTAKASQGLLTFTLPKLTLPMVVLPKNRRQVALMPVVDTIAIDADAGTYDLTWRASLPLARSLHEIHTVAAGSVCKRWWKSRVYGSEDCGCGGFETDDEDLAPVTEALED
jgi:hypothetical protein